jgi:biopolymer transport protein ExbD
MIKVMMMMMMVVMVTMMMMMKNDVHLDIPLLANFKKLQPFHDSGAEQRQGCTSHI